MADYTIGAYYTAPRGLASSCGFEEEDARQAARLAQNALNAKFRDASALAADLASMIWQQEKHRFLCNEQDFIQRVTADVEMVFREHAVDGVLPEGNKNP